MSEYSSISLQGRGRPPCRPKNGAEAIFALPSEAQICPLCIVCTPSRRLGRWRRTCQLAKLWALNVGAPWQSLAELRIQFGMFCGIVFAPWRPAWSKDLGSPIQNPSKIAVNIAYSMPGSETISWKIDSNNLREEVLSSKLTTQALPFFAIYHIIIRSIGRVLLVNNAHRSQIQQVNVESNHFETPHNSKADIQIISMLKSNLQRSVRLLLQKLPKEEEWSWGSMQSTPKIACQWGCLDFCPWSDRYCREGDLPSKTLQTLPVLPNIRGRKFQISCGLGHTKSSWCPHLRGRSQLTARHGRKVDQLVPPIRSTKRKQDATAAAGSVK